MSEKKSPAEALKEKLFLKRKNAYLTHDEAYFAKAESFATDYKAFIDAGKTERLVVTYSVKMLEAEGFVPFDASKTYKSGDKIYFNNRGKALYAAVIGTEPLENGVRIAAAHIDSPRIDIKPNPLYEDGELALLKTHYYGGVKKYQWVALPLSLIGVVITKAGKTIEVNIGEDDNDPCFVINDLLPHLGQEQAKRPSRETIRGEELNVLIGSRPFVSDEGSELIKLNVMNILFEKYGMVEEDFLTAELEMVPCQKARDIGFDRSMIAAYGHDDRVCAFPALVASINAKNPKHTTVTVLADKEEVGSDGNTGMQSRAFEFFIKDLAEKAGTRGHKVLSKSKCYSADVTAAFDPTFPDVHERKNAALINQGVSVTKYTGSGGKGGTNDANVEFVAEVCQLLNKNSVSWQTAELGKVDAGGGGTVAKFIANQNVEVVDIGVPVLSMHAPLEVISKMDLYATYEAFFSFYDEK